MKTWNFSEENRKCFKELNEIDPSVEGVITDMVMEISRYDPHLIKMWQVENLKPKIDSYLLRYVIPLYELLNREHKNKVTQLLVIQLFSCVSWRTFDNCNDAHLSQEKAHFLSLSSALSLLDYSKSVFPGRPHPALQEHYWLMTEQAVLEKNRPVELNAIWKRCSIFLFAAELANLSKKSTALFKEYINYSGLAHDTHDFFSDISGGVISLPVDWMKQLNPDEVLSIQMVKLLYQKIATEVRPLEHHFKRLTVAGKFPLLNYWLEESRRTFHDK